MSQLCHIQAAEPGGPRFNSGMTNEERRNRNNLILLCYEHHVETDNEGAWPVHRLRQIKAVHEARFEAAIQRIAASTITDITKSVRAQRPQTSQQLNDRLGWGLSQEQLAESLSALLRVFEALRKVAPDTREVLLIVIERGSKPYWSSAEDVGLPLVELKQVTSVDRGILLGHIDTLRRYRLAYLQDDEERSDLKDYCQRADIELRSLVIDLRFDLLD